MAAHNSRFAGACALLFAWVVGTHSRAQAWCQMVVQTEALAAVDATSCTHPSAIPMRWMHRCTGLSLSERMPSSSLASDQVRAVFQSAINTWTSVQCGGRAVGLDLALLPETNECSQAAFLPSSPNVNSIMFVRSGWTARGHDPRAFALTLVFHDPATGEILDADMELNEARGPYAICPAAGCASGQTDLQNVITHELGHYFGLAHSDVMDATMYLSADARETSKRDLDADDIAGLCAIYPSGTFTTACNRTPANGLGLSCRPRTCNCSVPGTHRGLSALAIGAPILFLLAMARRRRSQAAR